MIRLLTFLFLACVSGASYATCSGGSISYGPPISVDLSDKLTPATPTWDRELQHPVQRLV